MSVGMTDYMSMASEYGVTEIPGSNETGIRSRPIGLGASELSVDSTNAPVGYDEDGNLMTGDWADQPNAMDALLNSDNFRNGRVPDAGVISNVQVVNQDEPVIRVDNQETAVKGILDETPVSNLFFSN